MNEFCGLKGIKREFSVARTPQQNGVAERKNRTLIEAARTMLADSLLPTVFWAEAVNTACYVLNRVLVTKPHNKTPYELIIGRPPSISFMRPFGCPVTILNTLDPLGKFDGKAEEGFLVGYSINSKAFRVFNSQTRKVEENLHVNFLENKPNVAGQGPNWLFDIDSLTNSMNYQPVTAGNQTNKNAGPQEANGDTGLKKSVDARQSEGKNVSTQQYIVFPLWSSISSSYKSSDEKYKNDTADDAAGETPVQKPASENEQALKNVLDKMMDQEKEATEQSDAVRKEFEAQCNRELLQGKATKASSTNSFNTVSTPVNAASAPRTSNDAGPSFVPLGGSFPLNVNDFPDDPLMPDLEDTAEVQNTGIFGSAYDDDDDLDTYNSPYADQVVGAEADFNNMEPSTVVSPIPTTRIHSIHPKNQIIRDPKSAVQTRGMSKKNSGEHAMISYIQKQRRTNHKDFQNCLFACFLSQQEPTKIAQALDDESWVEAMQEELLQFKIQKVWTLVDLPYGKKAIGTKWVYRNKKDERGIVVRNKARLVAQGYKQEEGIDYDDVLLMIARCKKHTVVANSTTEAEYISASHCYGQVLWIQNQMLDYGFNFMQTKIHVDNESAICVIKNHVYHSKTKHIEIMHHFIRDSYEKRLIEMAKIHTNHNVADLLTKAFDVLRNPSKEGRKIRRLIKTPGLVTCAKKEKEPTVLVERQVVVKKEKKKLVLVDAEHSTLLFQNLSTNAAANMWNCKKGTAKIARQLQEEINKATQEQEKQEVVTEADPTHVIDWSDPAVLRYHAQLNRPYSIAEVRKNMVMYLKNQGGYKKIIFKGIKDEEIRPIFEKVCDQIQVLCTIGFRNKKKYRKEAKDQKMILEKEELKAYLDLVPREEFAMEIESLAAKYPIADWKTYVLTENFMYYQIIRADGGSKNYKIFSEMLDDFDIQDVMDLHRLVEERYVTTSLEDILMLWGTEDLFQPDEER
ncbi:putative ribonuclease H-like domain-containing protein [Tanacetum coccineum]